MSYQVSYVGGYPKPKRILDPRKFEKRQKVMVWCRNNKHLFEEIWIHHPNGDTESYATRKIIHEANKEKKTRTI